MTIYILSRDYQSLKNGDGFDAASPGGISAAASFGTAFLGTAFFDAAFLGVAVASAARAPDLGAVAPSTREENEGGLDTASSGGVSAAEFFRAAAALGTVLFGATSVAGLVAADGNARRASFDSGSLVGVFDTFFGAWPTRRVLGPWAANFCGVSFSAFLGDGD